MIDARRRLAGVAVALLIAAGGSAARLGAQAPAAQPAPPAPLPYTLSVTTTDGVPSITLEAAGARLSDIAEDLARRLRTRIGIGPSLASETTFARLINSPLEPAMGALAWRVLIDYEFRRDAQPVPQGIFLLGRTDPDPELNASGGGPVFGLMIEGNTEELPSSGPDPLKIAYERNRLSISSRKQPLMIVLRSVAEALSIPLDLRYDAMEPVDIELRDLTPEEAVARLSPNARLHMRVAVDGSKRTPLRIVVEQDKSR